MELSLECVHPVPEATAAGINYLGSQIVGIILILVLPNFAQPPDPLMVQTQKCSVAHGQLLNYTSEWTEIFFDMTVLVLFLSLI